MKINKGQFCLEPWWRRILFDLKRGKGHFFHYFLNRIRWHYYPRFKYVSRFPDHVDIETSSACNLHCPMCYTITDEFKKKVKHLLMDFDLFKKIIDQCSQYKIYSIRLSFRGEPFLHPKIIDMVRYAKSRGISEVSTLTNGLALNEKRFKELMEAGLDWLTISFDGLGKTYERIRRPAKFKEALFKIKKYHKIKKRAGKVKPLVKVQSLWPAIEKNPQAYYNTFALITDQVASNPLIDYLFKDKDIIYEEDFTCPVLYQRMVIGSDGKVLLCICDELGEYIIGDAKKQSLYKIWHGKRMQEARKLHKQKDGFKKIKPCIKCFYPRKTRKVRKKLYNRILNIDNYIGRSQKIGK